MKPLNFILLTTFFIAIVALCNAQNVITRRDGQKITAVSVYLIPGFIVFTDTKKQGEITSSIQVLKSVLFNNGLFLTYHDFHPEFVQVSGYNSTVNLVNGDFFTAEIIRITADSISYLSPALNDTLFISTQDVIEINYLNGISEHYASNDSAFAKAEKVKPKGPPPVINNSTALYCGINLGYINSWTKNFSYNNNNYFEPYDLKGFAPSLSLYYDFAASGSLNVSLVYAPKGQGFRGYSYNYPSPGQQFDTQIKLSYLEIPFSYQLQYGGDHFRMFTEFGFCAGYLLSAKLIQTSPTNEEKKITPDLKHFEFGMLFGLGFKYYLKNGCMLAGVQYQFDLTSVTGYNTYNIDNQTYTVSGGLNRNFIFYAGYAININVFKKQKAQGDFQ